jgi:hypothetical protein
MVNLGQATTEEYLGGGGAMPKDELFETGFEVRE